MHRVCQPRDAGLVPMEVLARADSAMYEAKRRGQSGVEVLTEDLDRAFDERHQMERSLRRALSSSEIDAWGQPIVDLRNGRVSGVELLARWNLRGQPPVPPSVFIPLAEASGLVIEQNIETEEEAAIMEELGATYGQGFLHGRPLDLVDLEADLRARLLADTPASPVLPQSVLP